MHIKEGNLDIPADQISLADRWILSRLGRTMNKVSEALDDYRFNEAASAAYNFVWHELCDWYIEAAKPALYGKMGAKIQQATLSVLWRTLRDTLVLLHPFMPFVTEEIWHKLPGTRGSIMKAVYPIDAPDAKDLSRDTAAEDAMQVVIDVITGVRNIRGEMNVAPSLELNVTFRTRDARTRSIVEANTDMIMDLAKLESFEIEESGEKPRASATAIIDKATIFASLEGIIDVDKESARLQKEIDKLSKELAGVSKKLANKGFLDKAPEEIVAKVKEKHEQLSRKQEKLKTNLNKIADLKKQ
jgi:valyl-tRNA synthetase